MKPYLFILAVSSAVALSACSSTTYSVRVVNKEAGDIYLTYQKGTVAKVGDIFAVYKLDVVAASDGGHHHGGSSQHIQKELIGEVQVTQIVDEQTATVKIISGTVEDGVIAEKVK